VDFIKNLDISKLISRYSSLALIENDIVSAINAMIITYETGGKILMAGNGGSSADAEHFCGELNKGFLISRSLKKDIIQEFTAIYPDFDFSKIQRGLPSIPVSSLQSSISASANDLSWEYAFAQTINAIGAKNDLFVGITTSGNSLNIYRSFQIAKLKGMRSILLSGSLNSRCSEIADISIKVPSTITHHVQELHLPIYHAICIEIEHYFFA
tara:strand:- start:1409 stop:2044 length:636 start_codon:yes stop_codon:yes gene_type:complete